MDAVYNPTILDVEEGNMIRVKGPDDKEEWGQMVDRVDYKNQQVLVRHFMGGTKEFTKWVPIDHVTQTWNIGGKERAEQLTHGLQGEVEKVLKGYEDLEREQEIEKHIKFKK